MGGRHVKQTVTVRLDPTPEQHALLLATMKRFNVACQDMATWAAEHNVRSRWTIERGCYHRIRAQHGLSAQMTTRAAAKVGEQLMRLRRGQPATFHPHGAVVYDSRIMSFKGAEHVSLWTLGGRQQIAMRLSDYHRARLASRHGQADLILRAGRFHLALTIDAVERSELEPDGTLGVDLGITNLATDSDGVVHSGEAIERCRTRYERRRAVLQALGTRPSRRRLRKTSGREARFRRDQNHVISKQLVGKAQGTKRQIALEDLKGITARITVRRSQRSRHKGWAFFQLREFITYKAKLAGVPLVIVDPRNTSRTCHECGHCEKANRRSQAEFVCKSCGHAAPADLNAARNIAARGDAMRPMVPEATPKDKPLSAVVAAHRSGAV
jgi:putative transposase